MIRLRKQRKRYSLMSKQAAWIQIRINVTVEELIAALEARFPPKVAKWDVGPPPPPAPRDFVAGTQQEMSLAMAGCAWVEEQLKDTPFIWGSIEQDGQDYKITIEVPVRQIEEAVSLLES